MNFLGTLLRSLRDLPPFMAGLIIILSYVVCLVLMLAGFPSPLNGALFSIPMAFVGWRYKQRGVLIFLVILTVTFIVCNTIQLGLHWPASLLASLITGILVLGILGIIISFLRDALDISDEARQKAQQAEEHIALAYEQQKQLHQSKATFFSHVNHELRTPLTTALGYLELLHTHHEQLDPERRKAFLAQALQGCEELRSLVETIGEAADIESDTLFLPQTLRLKQEVCEVLERFDPALRQAPTLTLDIPENLMVWADRRHLRLVLRHLFSNAFKYSLPPIRVVVSARQEGESQQRCPLAQVRIDIKDSCGGIAPEEIPLLFEKGVRLERHVSGLVRGSGLGLYICRHLVTRMQGRVWAEGAGVPGVGCCFSLTLPTSPPDLI